MSKQLRLAALLCLAGTWFGFANPVLQIPGLVLALPLSLAWVATRAHNPGQAFTRTWMIASLAYAASLYWVSIPVHYFGPLPWIASIPCPVLLGMYLGLYAGLFGLSLAWARPRLPWPFFCLFAWCMWTGLEYIRGSIFTGFPWLGLSQALSPWPAALQGASYLGAFGLSGLLAGLAVCVVTGFEHKAAWIVAAVTIAVVLVFGVWRLDQPPAGRQTSVHIALIQGNISLTHKWNPQFQDRTVHRYLQLSRRALKTGKADLLIWPETAMPFYLQESSKLAAEVKAFCRTNRVAVLTGSPGYTLAPGSTGPDVAYHNQAYLIDPSGRIAGQYGKQRLVPFGEYIPFGRFFPFVHKLVAGAGDFRPGKHSKPLTYDHLAMGTLICYEVIFPGLVQQRVQDGANVLVNISNDAWFGHSSGAWQHLHQAVLRAVEQGRSLLRSTNTGISALIDPRGRILAHSKWFIPRVLSADDVQITGKRTFFSRHFFYVRGLFFFLGAALGLFAAVRPPAPQPV